MMAEVKRRIDNMTPAEMLVACVAYDIAIVKMDNIALGGAYVYFHPPHLDGDGKRFEIEFDLAGYVSTGGKCRYPNELIEALREALWRRLGCG